MPRDRLRNDSHPIINLDDLIEAREEPRSSLADNVDALEDVDVDEALTFPHPHPHREEMPPEVETLDAPTEEDVGFDYRDSEDEMLPTDYAEPYSNALSAQPGDDEEIAVNEEILRISEIPTDDLIYECVVIDTPEEGGPRDLEDEG